MSTTGHFPKTRYSILLAAITVVSFGIFLPKLGFYLDDWAIIGNLYRSGQRGLWPLIRAFHETSGSFYHLRPADLLYFPAVYWFGGTTPWKYQLVYLALETAAALFIFHALRRATRDGPRSFLIACLFACYPSHTATHHCFLGPYTPAMTFFAAALWLHATWLDGKDRRALAGSLLCLATADLLYEAVLPLVLLMPLLGAFSMQLRADDWKETVKRIARGSAPALSVAAALTVYFIAIQRLEPQTISRKLAFDIGHALRVLGSGFECSFTGLADLFRHSAILAVRELHPLLWVSALCLAVAVAFAAPRLDEERPLGKAWLWGAAAIFFASYLPYAISADGYVPHTFDVQNRINGAPSLPAAIIVAYGVQRLRGRWRKAALAILFFGFTLINWETGREWTASWSLQQRVLEDISKRLPEPDDGAVSVLLKGAPLQLDSSPVFNESWTFDQALKLTTRRSDVSGLLWGEVQGGNLPAPGPGALLYDAQAGTLEPFRPAEKAAAL